MVNVVPVITFPIPVLAAGTCNLFPFPRIGDFRLATLEWIAEGKTGTDDSLACLVCVTDTPFPVHYAVQSFTYIVVSVWKSHATLTPLAKQDGLLWLQYD